MVGGIIEPEGTVFGGTELVVLMQLAQKPVHQWLVVWSSQLVQCHAMQRQGWREQTCCSYSVVTVVRTPPRLDLVCC